MNRLALAPVEVAPGRWKSFRRLSKRESRKALEIIEEKQAIVERCADLWEQIHALERTRTLHISELPAASELISLSEMTSTEMTSSKISLDRLRRGEQELQKLLAALDAGRGEE